ncbi:hypothetical protein OH77DRAFT_1526128 [Trametes cingulata]|nr:hypothetical protein OH77DRAFT_1526128 [Trametes cingulata]
MDSPPVPSSASGTPAPPMSAESVNAPTSPPPAFPPGLPLGRPHQDVAAVELTPTGPPLFTAPAPNLANATVQVGQVVVVDIVPYLVISLHATSSPNVFVATLYRVVPLPNIILYYPPDRLPLDFFSRFCIGELISLAPAIQMRTTAFTSIQPAILFNDRGISLPVLDGMTPFLRTNVLLSWNDTSMPPVWTILNHGPRFCHTNCYKRGVYCPAADRVRYCGHCAMWLHIQCLRPVPTLELKRRLTADFGWTPSTASASDILWWELITCPIERAPHIDFYHRIFPLSYESYLWLARSNHIHGRGPPLGGTFLWISEVNYPPIPNSLLAFSRDTQRFVCPGCGRCV